MMVYDTRFGPSAQTPEQRARVLGQMQAALPSLKTKATAGARQLYARYVAGELSWLDVHEALQATTRAQLIASLARRGASRFCLAGKSNTNLFWISQ
ncbi:MAG: hypothetical protein ACRYFX_25675 [Janthinobacterium lividum]